MRLGENLNNIKSLHQRNHKPIVGNKYAATIASIVSFAFIVIPLILVSLIFNRIKALGYILLWMLWMYLILVFSTDCGLGPNVCRLCVCFRRAMLGQSPKTNWRVYGIYATCFLVICLFASAERGEKAYMEGGGEEGKKN